MCQYQPQCPQSWKPDRLAAQIEDDTELVIASLTARRERENCGYVRTLLARKQLQIRPGPRLCRTRTRVPGRSSLIRACALGA